MRLCVAIAALTLTATALHAAESETLTGRVIDNQNRPVENATVLIYQAGVKQGYSTFCPSCYVDCGKRTLTDPGGGFSFRGLAAGLWFKLVVVHDGYTAAFINKADPSRGITETAVLNPRATVDDLDRVARGRILNSDGEPLAGAVILPQGVSYGEGSVYGTIDGLEPVAASNAQGEFEFVRNVGKKTASLLNITGKKTGRLIQLSLFPSLHRPNAFGGAGAIERK